MIRSKTSSWVRATLLIGCFTIAASGCHSSIAHSNEDLAAIAASTDTSSVSIVRQARSLYDYGPERPPLTITDHGFPGPHVADGTIPRMWIATATLKRSSPIPSYRIVARIRSARAYPPMGIQAGENYIWRSSWDSAAAASWKTKLVPGDVAAMQHALVRDFRKIEYTHGDPLEPRLVRILVASEGLGVCLDDPVCQPMGHCGSY